MTANFNAVDLKRIYADGRLVPFIGSGMSAHFGLPTTAGLIELMAGELGWDPDVFALSGDYRQLAEYYEETKGGIGPLRSRMDKLFNPSDDAILGSPAHSSLAKLQLPLIYTTNYDSIIERSLQLARRIVHVVASMSDMATVPKEATQVVHLHGTFSDDSSLVLTESSYFDRLRFESPLDIRLRADTLGRVLLFLGYSLEDINIRYLLFLLQRLRQATPQKSGKDPTAVLTSFGSNEVQRVLLSRLDVAVVELDARDRDGSLASLIEGLL